MRWMPEIKAGGGGEFEGVDACAGRDFYLEQGKSGPALTAYRAAVEIDPKNGATHLALGVGMATAGDAQNSEKQLRTAACLSAEFSSAACGAGESAVAEGAR